jgi:UPF0755 protein
MRRLVSVFLAAFTLLLVAAGATSFYVWARFTGPGPLAQEAVLVVPKGSGVSAIAELLEREGVIDHRLVFQVGVRLWGRGRHLKAGEYAFPAGVSARAAMGILIGGKSIEHQVTVAEGLTVSEIYAVLREDPLLEGDLPPLPSEGSLLPETYSYLRGDDRPALVDRMRKGMQQALDELWEGRASDIAVASKEEALVLASIVEKETGVASERGRVAAVFHNRLRRGMKLQSDPTVIYALTMGQMKLGRALTRDDLKFDSPYNTYQVTGLPPAPIANPGKAALRATLNPAASADLYFVADGTGGHAFAQTLDEHNRNVEKWRKIQSLQSGN